MAMSGKLWIAAAALGLAIGSSLGWLACGEHGQCPRVESLLGGMGGSIEAAVVATLEPGRDKNLDEISEIAARIESESGFPAQVMVAQWALESDWGKQPACRHNYFGMKRAQRSATWCMARTSEIYTPNQIEEWDKAHPNNKAVTKKPAGPGLFEVEMSQAFADYPSLEQSARDYAEHIMTSPPYGAAWVSYQKSKDPKHLLRDLAGVYWTDTSYVAKALSVMDRPEVVEALAAARSPEAPAPPPEPRGLPPLQSAGLAIVLGNLGVMVIGMVLRANSRARHEEFKRRVDAIEVRVVTGLQGQIEGTLESALKGHTVDLMDRFNGRYLKTERFEQAYGELLGEVHALKPGLSPPSTVRKPLQMG